MSQRKTAVVICPGRGTYNQTELGYLKKHHAEVEVIGDFLDKMDVARTRLGQLPISELDAAERFSARTHTSGENASALIYACALADFKSIDRDAYDIVAVTGNSMGWYLALACAEVLSEEAGFELVNTMGTLMHTQGTGGQVIYPLVNTQWQRDPQLLQTCERSVAEVNSDPECEVSISIKLGGMLVLAGNDSGIKALLKALPPEQERFPFQLHQHAAFHSPVLAHIPDIAKSKLKPSMFAKPELPLIDGRGHIWQTQASALPLLYAYTLEQQITETYDFSSAIEVAIKEYAPDKLIVLGPGTTLGPPIAQALIQHQWLGLDSKAEFSAMQKNDPFVLSMGIDAQRQHVVQK